MHYSVFFFTWNCYGIVWANFSHIPNQFFPQQFVLHLTEHTLISPQTPQIMWRCRWLHQEPSWKAARWPLNAAATPTRLSNTATTGCSKTDTWSEVDRVSTCPIFNPPPAAGITVKPGTTWAREESSTLTPLSSTWMFSVCMIYTLKSEVLSLQLENGNYYFQICLLCFCEHTDKRFSLKL